MLHRRVKRRHGEIGKLAWLRTKSAKAVVGSSPIVGTKKPYASLDVNNQEIKAGDLMVACHSHRYSNHNHWFKSNRRDVTTFTCGLSGGFFTHIEPGMREGIDVGIVVGRHRNENLKSFWEVLFGEQIYVYTCKQMKIIRNEEEWIALKARVNDYQFVKSVYF